MRVAQFFFFAVGIYLVSLFIPGLQINNFFSALLYSCLILILIFVLWPILLRYTKGFLFLTFGLGSFFLSAFILWLASVIIPGVTVNGWGWITAPLAVAFVFVIVTGILNVDDDEVYARSIHYGLKRKTSKSSTKEKPGFVFLEIDGLSERVLREAIKKGAMPTLAGLVADGSYKIKEWETDLSSQTGASQAGILHGCNKDIPAFRWVDKSNNNKIVSSNGIGDAQAIEKLISNGKGLLSVNGGAVTDLFTGDSKDNILVYSVLKDIKQLYSESWSAFYSRPFNVAHIIVLTFLDVLVEMRSRYRQWRDDVQPRLKHRGLKYFAARAGANVILRELSTYTVIGDIILGQKDAVYTTYFGYDEVAHHCGVSDNECFYILSKIDKRISRIIASKEYGKRPYYISILSDHGQTNGATFKQRYGSSLHEVVKKLLPENEEIYQDLDSNQDHFGQMINAPSDSIKRKIKGRSEEKKKKEARAIVLASGNLGLIYFTIWPRRLTLEEIDQVYPNMIKGLLSEDGVGFLMVNSQNQGSIVLSGKGRYFLKDDKVEGENPLATFGEHAAMHLRRTNSFNHVPDILVMSMFDTEKNEVAAFEELVGSHGGLGGDQSKPFIMYPSEWNLDNEEIIGAERVYQVFMKKINGATNFQ
jgi:putative membrane protein